MFTDHFVRWFKLIWEIDWFFLRHKNVNPIGNDEDSIEELVNPVSKISFLKILILMLVVRKLIADENWFLTRRKEFSKKDFLSLSVSCFHSSESMSNETSQSFLFMSEMNNLKKTLLKEISNHLFVQWKEERNILFFDDWIDQCGNEKTEWKEISDRRWFFECFSLKQSIDGQIERKKSNGRQTTEDWFWTTDRRHSFWW